MKIKDLIILVKYAQGLVVFNSFFDYVRHMSEDERKKFLSQTAMLIKKLTPQDSDIIAAMKKSEFSTGSKRFELLLDKGSGSQVENLLEFQEADLQATLKLLIQIFTDVYKRACETNKNNEGAFWYWDYSKPATSFKVVELDVRQTIDINNF